MFKRFKSKLKKIGFARGSGELLGFAISLPLVMVIFCAIVMAAQHGVIKQRLEYATYTAARAAVVQENLASAQAAAALMADDVRVGAFGVRDIKVELETVAGRLDGGIGNVRWEKGSLLKVVLTADVDTIAPFPDSELSSEITMMIERPANTL
jgi:hypothetical protein